MFLEYCSDFQRKEIYQEHLRNFSSLKMNNTYPALAPTPTHYREILGDLLLMMSVYQLSPPSGLESQRLKTAEDSASSAV